jgi:hypothetical protein
MLFLSESESHFRQESKEQGPMKLNILIDQEL